MTALPWLTRFFAEWLIGGLGFRVSIVGKKGM